MRRRVSADSSPPARRGRKRVLDPLTTPPGASRQPISYSISEDADHPVEPREWETALRRAAQVTVTMVIGESDTGKTTLVTALANSLLARRQRVGIIDADLGQSEIGPPTTIGLGRVRTHLRRLADAEAFALYFVGVTSPARSLLGTVIGTRRMLDRAGAARMQRVVIDTSGLVSGHLGRTLKQAKIDATDPDLVICLERAGECEHIVAAYAGATRPEVIRLTAAAAVRSRSAEDRRRYREGRLKEYFASARRVALDLRRVRLHGPDGEAPAGNATAGVSEGALVGLLDKTRATLGLGLVRGIDVVAGVIHLETAVPETEVATVVIGRESYPA
jgi:polynucleotide 5'-kinase involved in rRNA processing